MSYSPFPGPVPAWNNPPIQPQNYQPSQFFIYGINLGPLTTVTTTVNNNYVIGQLVRLLIPNGYGCTQLDEQTAYVVSVPTLNSVVLDLDSSQNVNQFISASLSQQPQIVAVGDINTGIISSTGANIQFESIPGAFVNIS